MTPLVAPELARPRERETRPVERAQAVVLLGLGGRLFEGCGWLKRNDDEERPHFHARHRCARHRYVLVIFDSGAAEAVACGGVARFAQRCAVRWHCSLRLLMRLNVLLQQLYTADLLFAGLLVNANALQAASAKCIKPRML